MSSPAEDSANARDTIRAAGVALLEAIDPALMPASLDERLDAFCELAFGILAPTGVSWLGFYRVAASGDDMTLVACRDRPACSPIGLHGVCGQSLRTGRTRIVTDVLDLGDDYVACDPRDRSEIVIPLLGPGENPPTEYPASHVLDLDSFDAGRFSDRDDALLRAALERAGLAPVLVGPALLDAAIGTD